MQKTVEQLGKLFGSTAQVKCMRLFLQSPDTAFAVYEIADRTKSVGSPLRSALRALKVVGFIESKKVIVKKRLKNGKIQTKKYDGFALKKSYPLIPHLYSLLIECGLMNPLELQTLLQPMGKMHLVVLSGLFMHDSDRSLDLLVVADRISQKVLDRTMKTLESEIGREIRYALFSLPEYLYRMEMYDKLLRDVFDYPHMKIIDKIKK